MDRRTEGIDFVIGVDTHKQSHTSSAVDSLGTELATAKVAANAAGYRQMLQFARTHAAGRRIWAIEGTGRFGRGLTSDLLERDEPVVEIDRPSRPARRLAEGKTPREIRRCLKRSVARRLFKLLEKSPEMA